jgi:hypothetical protein
MTGKCGFKIMADLPSEEVGHPFCKSQGWPVEKVEPFIKMHKDSFKCSRYALVAGFAMTVREL